MTTLEDSTSIKAQQATGTGGFDLPCDADAAFLLFSPEGERLWITEWDWDPRPVFPDAIEFRRDTVFRQGTGVFDAIWTIVDVNWAEYRAEYVRVAPDSHAAHIVVKVDASGPESCHVNVEYTVTVYAEQGILLLDSVSEKGMAEKMQSWQRQIEISLENKKN